MILELCIISWTIRLEIVKILTKIKSFCSYRSFSWKSLGNIMEMSRKCHGIFMDLRNDMPMSPMQ